MRKESKNFAAETKELLNLMIHSIYTHKEIFLRELISNSSDAIDKLKFKALTNSEILGGNNKFEIKITPNLEKRELIIEDNGIGMSYEEVLENIGTIAKSGSKAFLKELTEGGTLKESGVEIIGQFGVGFYSAFMVADKITLESKSPFSEKGVRWSSIGDGTYDIEEIELTQVGTKITLHIKDSEEDIEFLEGYKLKSLIKKYSDYVRYPILVEEEVANSTKPIWKESKSEIKEEAYNEFYKSNFHDYEEPLHHIHLNIQGNLDYTALLYIPAKTPYDFYTKEFKRGLQLYTKNVFIMDKCEELIPEYFSFIKGLVDCDLLSLNISREILQKNSELSNIAKNLEKKIISEFEKIMRNDRERYIKIWEAFGRNIKFGIQESFGMNGDKLKNLLIFKSSKDEKYVTLKEYVERRKLDQKEIYYISGEELDVLKNSPKLKNITSKGYEVIYLLDRIDEFALKTLGTFEEMNFKSVNDSDLDIEEIKEEREKEKTLEKENKSILDKIKSLLGDKVEEVKLTTALGEDAVSLSSKGEVSLEMEKTLSVIPGNEGVKAKKVLEINPNHGIFKRIQGESSEEVVQELSEILLTEALLIEGFPIKNPLEFINKVNKYIK